MDTSQTTLLSTATSSHFKTVGTASGALLAIANLELSQGWQGSGWELAWARDVHSRQLRCGHPVLEGKTVFSMYAGYCMP